MRPALALDEIESKAKTTDQRRITAEFELIASKLKSAERLVVLDERGESLDSPALAAQLTRWRDGGAREAAFVIGGAFGLDPGLRARADLKLAFGAATWPHLLVRAMLAEQLYRAQQIAAGAPYHHG